MTSEKKVKTFLKKIYRYPASISNSAKNQIDNNVWLATGIKSLRKSSLIDNILSFFNNKLVQGASMFAMSVLVIISFVWIFNYVNNGEKNVNKVKAEISITPTSTSAFGIAEESNFVVKVGNDVSSEKIAENIEIYPPVDYEVEVENGTLNIIPSDNLLPDTIYSVKLAQGTELSKGNVLEEDMSWTFVTESNLEVTSTSPMDSDSRVSVNESVIVEFSRFDLDLQSFKDNFKINPHIDGDFDKVGNKIKFTPSTNFIGGVRYEVLLEDKVATISGKILQSEYKFSFITASDDIGSNVYVTLNDGCFSEPSSNGINLTFVNDSLTCNIAANAGNVNVIAYDLSDLFGGQEGEYVKIVNNLGTIDKEYLLGQNAVWSDEYTFDKDDIYEVRADSFENRSVLVQYVWTYESIVEERFEILFFENKKIGVSVDALENVSVNCLDSEFDTTMIVLDRNLQKIGEYEINSSKDLSEKCENCKYYGYWYNDHWVLGNIDFVRGIQTVFVTDKNYYSSGDNVRYVGFLKNVSNIGEVDLRVEYVKNNKRFPLLEQVVEVDESFNKIEGNFELPENFNGELFCSLYYDGIFLFESPINVKEITQISDGLPETEDIFVDTLEMEGHNVLGISEYYQGGEDAIVELNVSGVGDGTFNGKMIVKITDNYNSVVFWDTSVEVNDGKATINFHIPYLSEKCVAEFVIYDDGGNILFDEYEFSIVKDIGIKAFIPYNVRSSSINKFTLQLTNSSNNIVRASLLLTSNGACSLSSQEEIPFEIMSKGVMNMEFEFIAEDNGECELELSLKTNDKTLLISQFNIKIDEYELGNPEIIKLQPEESYSFTYKSKLEGNLYASSNPISMFKSFKDIQSSEQAIKYLLLTSLIDGDAQFIDESLRIIYEDDSLNSCLNYENETECDHELIIMSKIASIYAKNNGAKIWKEWEDKLENYLEGLLYDETISLDFKLMTIWVLSYDKNSRGLVSAMYLYENEKDLDILQKSYLLISFENYSSKTLSSEIFNQIISTDINVDDSELLSRYLNSVSILGEEIIKYTDYELLENNDFGIESISTFFEIWSIGLMNDLKNENQKYSLIVDGNLISNYDKNNDLLWTSNDLVENNELEVTFKNNEKDLLILYVRK